MNKTTFGLKIFLGMAVILLFNVHSFPWWYANHTNTAFVSNSGGDGEGFLNCSYSEPLETYVVNGAGFFLESYSTTLIVMKKIEWVRKEGISYFELYYLLNNASRNMRYANENYQKLVVAASNSQYNLNIIEKLKKFDYDSFQKNHLLNAIIFEEVVCYLSKGDVREVYGKILSDTDELIKMLDEVNLQIKNNSFPSISAIWKLNQKFTQSLLFGQYLAQVFDSILNI